MSEADDEVEDLKVNKIDWEGVKYLLDKQTGDVYDFGTKDKVGKYDYNEQKLTFKKKKDKIKHNLLKKQNRRKKITPPYIPTLETIQEEGTTSKTTDPRYLKRETINTHFSGRVDVDVDGINHFVYLRGTTDKIGVTDENATIMLFGEGGDYEYDDDYMEDFEDIMIQEPKEYVSRAAEIDKAIEELQNDYEKTTDPKERKKISKLLQKLIADVENATEIDRANKAKIDKFNDDLEKEQQKQLKKRKKLLEQIRIEAAEKTAAAIEKADKERAEKEAARKKKEYEDAIKPAEILRRGVEYYMSTGLATIDRLTEAIKKYNEYRKLLKTIPVYPEELYRELKPRFTDAAEKAKVEIIRDLLRDKKGYEDVIKNPTRYADGGDNETPKGIKKRDALVADSQEKLKKVMETLDEYFTKEEISNAKKRREGTGYTFGKSIAKAELNGAGFIDNPKLYEQVKGIADIVYEKPSAFKSGFIVKKYKELGGTYSGEKPNKSGIARWFKEEWKDVGNQEYPVFRPTKRITKKTPLTIDEIEPSNLEEQIALKQEIKGDANLPPFQEKTGGKVVALGVQAEKIPKQDEIWKWSNPVKVAEMARKYLGEMAVVFRSTKPKKKYMIFDPINSKWVFFGEMGYEDFTKHQDPKRRENYLTRTKSIKGNWKNNRYSANNLSRNILW